MNLQTAQALAHLYMDRYDLRRKGWRFKYDNAKNRFGVCKYQSKVIGLSKPLTDANDQVRVVDTILHEIAHALVGPGHGHDNVWKRMCIEIGCKPERCFTSKDTNLVAGRFKAVCGGCGKTHTRHKRPRGGVRVACKCQSGIPWDKKKVLQYSC